MSGEKQESFWIRNNKNQVSGKKNKDKNINVQSERRSSLKHQ